MTMTFRRFPRRRTEETSDEEDDAAWGDDQEPEPPKAPKKPNAEAKQPPRKGRKLEFGSPKPKPSKGEKADTTKPKKESEPKAKKEGGESKPKRSKVEPTPQASVEKEQEVVPETPQKESKSKRQKLAVKASTAVFEKSVSDRKLSPPEELEVLETHVKEAQKKISANILGILKTQEKGQTIRGFAKFNGTCDQIVTESCLPLAIKKFEELVSEKHPVDALFDAAETAKDSGYSVELTVGSKRKHT